MKPPLPELTASERRAATPAPTVRALRAADLFGDSRELVIEHASGNYRLRITQNNKLILTK